MFIPHFAAIVTAPPLYLTLPMLITCLFFLFVLGAILGSFAACQVWRLYYRYHHKKPLGKRSVCLHCGHQLSFSENIPIFSWLALKGRCKKCHRSIGRLEIVSEISFAILLPLIGAFFYLNYPFTITTCFQFLIFTIAAVIFWILIGYDAKWHQLPTIPLTLINACAIIYLYLVPKVSLLSVTDNNTINYVIDILSSIALLAGTYFLLYFFSKETLVGSGDWLLCLAIAIFLQHWWLAFIELFLANFLALIYALLFQKRPFRRSKIPFGPFLVLAFFAIFLASPILLQFAPHF